MHQETKCLDRLEHRGGGPAGESGVFVPPWSGQIKAETLHRLKDVPSFQVVHWDHQAPGVGRDRADRLVDMYASGEQRSYGPLFLQRKMNISSHAFSEGDFSLTVSDIQVCDACVSV